MFQHEGPERTAQQNRILAAYLACIGGFVNSVGFVLVGNFTSHVTGNVGRLASALAHGVPAGAVLAMIAAFFSGAVVATLVIEGASGVHRARGYGAALSLEAVLVMIVALVPGTELAATLGLSAAMGMQNSMVTRLSGAVVRTTHLTGVVTDMGIEVGRWIRRDPGRNVGRLGLLGTVAGAFATGAVAGAFAGAWAHGLALLAAGVALLVGAAIAYRSSLRDAA